MLRIEPVPLFQSPPPPPPRKIAFLMPNANCKSARPSMTWCQTPTAKAAINESQCNAIAFHEGPDLPGCSQFPLLWCVRSPGWLTPPGLTRPKACPPHWTILPWLLQAGASSCCCGCGELVWSPNLSNPPSSFLLLLPLADWKYMHFNPITNKIWIERSQDRNSLKSFLLAILKLNSSSLNNTMCVWKALLWWLPTSTNFSRITVGVHCPPKKPRSPSLPKYIFLDLQRDVIRSVARLRLHTARPS